MAILQ
jgi:hypothetical protein